MESPTHVECISGAVVRCTHQGPPLARPAGLRTRWADVACHVGASRDPVPAWRTAGPPGGTSLRFIYVTEKLRVTNF
jgi:hypothetical protein